MSASAKFASPGPTPAAPLKGWLDNCVVPILVKEYLAVLQREKVLAQRVEPVAQCAASNTATAEVIQ
jgi:hypothetical protein